VAVEERGAEDDGGAERAGAPAAVVAQARRHQRQEREDAAFAVVVGAHDEADVLDADDERERPEDEREEAEDVGGARRHAVLGADALLERVEGAGADVAEDDAESAERQRRRAGTLAGAQPGCGRGHRRSINRCHKSGGPSVGPMETLEGTMSNAATKMSLGHNQSTGGRLVTVDGRTLPLRGTSVRAEAKNGVARVVVEQRFVNAFDEPLAVTYTMPLPADGAVSGYAFTIGERRVVGEVDRRQAARERFEEAIASGHTAALVEQERASLFTQELGNVPARAEIVAELVVDQKLV